MTFALITGGGRGSISFFFKASAFTAFEAAQILHTVWYTSSLTLALSHLYIFLNLSFSLSLGKIQRPCLQLSPTPCRERGTRIAPPHRWSSQVAHSTGQPRGGKRGEQIIKACFKFMLGQLVLIFTSSARVRQQLFRACDGMSRRRLCCSKMS